jgi:hypothetical protein
MDSQELLFLSHAIVVSPVRKMDMCSIGHELLPKKWPQGTLEEYHEAFKTPN